MIKKWKLVHEDNALMIDNEGGKKLGYNPNFGAGILEQDGYAFKDLNENGSIDIFEDWREPMVKRVEDFMKQYDLIQKDGMLYYKKGFIRIPKDLSFDVMDHKIQNVLHELLAKEQVDQTYLEEHYLFIVLLLMFDKDDGSKLQDYTITTFIQGIEKGLLENLMYSLAVSIRNYFDKRQSNKLISTTM